MVLLLVSKDYFKPHEGINGVQVS